jgi:hypothetical protein
MYCGLFARNFIRFLTNVIQNQEPIFFVGYSPGEISIFSIIIKKGYLNILKWARRAGASMFLNNF